MRFPAMKPGALPKPLLATLAVLFAVSAIFYSGLWIYAANRLIPVELGFDNQYVPESHEQLVRSVAPDSPAARAGLRPGDRIVAIFGARIEEDLMTLVWSQHQPGDFVDLTVQRPGVASPMQVRAIFRSSGPAETSTEGLMAQHVGHTINNLFPVVFVTVGLTVLFFRLQDPNAWLMALMFGGFIAIPSFANSFAGVPPSLKPLAIGYRALFNPLVSPLFYFFFAVFPTRSPLDRRLPWLKWICPVIGVAWGMPAFLSGPRASLPASAAPLGHPGYVLRLCFNYALLVLGLISLTSNAMTADSSEARRKIRVILWGTLIGVVPAALVLGANDFFGFGITLWIGAITVMLLWLFPLSFAYAVVKHRVLEIPVLLRRSARYLLVQRGFVLLLVTLSAAITIGFALLFARYLQSHAAALPGGIALGAIFGTVLFWTGSQVHKDVGKRIDRAFFRSAYDARMILEDLVEKTRTATDRKDLAALMGRHLKAALQPSSVAVFLETGEDRLSAMDGQIPPECATISSSDEALRQLARDGMLREVTGDAAAEASLPASLRPLRPDSLVPVLGRDDRLAGLIVLGVRLSEEPYSREDKNLLALVANQAGVALENIRLGEKVAERIEAERRTAQEMEFARQVQARLFPQKLPPMKTLDYSGVCSQARTVGGDYYDFLELRPGRLGMVLGDIAGKGVPGALLMANLQANLRSQYATAIQDLPRLLASVNRLFYQNTADASYATLFFADYDESTRLLRYANCGHLPALLLRAVPGLQPTTAAGPVNGPAGGGAPEIAWLSSTSTVLGLFEDWQCETAEVRLAPGDTLVLYTDGVTEAVGRDGEEFGEGRLLEALQSQAHLSVPQLLESVVDAVKQFSGAEQDDDVTLIIARCTA